MTAPGRPLAGLRVVDLADEWGELAGRLLAELGADVVRGQPPGGTPSRSRPPLAPDGTSLYFAHRNAGKRPVAVDTDEVRTLVAAADVLIESARPGHWVEGLDPATLTAELPQLIVCSITAFGQTGAYAGYEATDDVVVALSGNLAMSGTPDKAPLLIPGALASDAAGVMGAYAVLSAIAQRRQTGRGQHLDVSALEAAAQLNTWGLPNTSDQLNKGQLPQTVRSGSGPLYQMFATADGHVRVIVLSKSQWHTLWEWMGRPEAFADPTWSEILTRLVNADVLNVALAEFFADKLMIECAAEAQRRGVVVTPMLKPADVLASDHFRSRGTFVETGFAGFFELDGARLTPEPATAELPWAGHPAPPTEATGEVDRPLTGVRVLDFGHGGVGVECARMLAEYGADVIKIETRTYPDFIRIVLGSEMTASFASSSRSKRSLGVNLGDPAGVALLLDLAEHADIVIENNSTGTMDRLGLGWDAWHARNPDLVMVSSQMMGSRGEFAGWIGYGPSIQAAGGLNWLWNFDDGDPPPGSNAIHPDHLTGRISAVGALAAWLGRDRLGGSHVEVAQVEALIGTLGDLLLLERLSPGAVRPRGNTSERDAPWGVFRCAGDEQWCAVTVRDDADWRGLSAAMGQPAWATDDRFATRSGRLAHRDELNAAVEQWTVLHASREVMERCQAEGVPAGAMLTTVDQLSDPHLAARGFCVEIDQQDQGRITLEGPAFTGSDMAAADIRQAPRLGEHTREIARELLGLDDTRIDELFAAGVLEVAP